MGLGTALTVVNSISLLVGHRSVLLVFNIKTAAFADKNTSTIVNLPAIAVGV